MQADTLLVSFCLPTLNRINYLKFFLDTFLANIPVWAELIVIDGGSSDGTREFLSDMSCCSDRMRFIASSTRRNLGLDLFESIRSSKGKYCWFLSDDDDFNYKHLEVLHQFLCNSNYCGMTVSYESYDNKLISKIPTVRPNYRSMKTTTRTYYSVSQLFLDLGQHLGYLPCHVIKRQSLIDVIDSDVFTGDDISNPWIITLIIGEVLKNQNKWCFINLPVIKNRTENDSTLFRVGEYNRQVITHVKFWEVVMRYCTPAVVKSSKMVYVRTRYLRSILTLKARNPDRITLRKIQSLHFETYKNIPLFRILYPLLFLPNGIYRFMLKMFKVIRNIS
jgi:glycosyltransferase involved in cell wall biosynthesis